MLIKFLIEISKQDEEGLEKAINDLFEKERFLEKPLFQKLASIFY